MRINKISKKHERVMEYGFNSEARFSLIINLYENIFQCENKSQKQLLIEKTLVELVDYTYYHFAQE